MARTPLEALHHLRTLAATGELERLCEEHDVELLVAFGSTTHLERAGEARDLDIAVQFRSTDRAALLELTGALETVLDVPVDVMDLRRAGVIGRFKALGAGIPLYEATRGLWASRQAAAVLEYLDTEELRRLDRQLIKESG